MDTKHITTGWPRFLWPVIALLVFASCGGGGGGLDPDPNPNPQIPTGQWEGTVATSSSVNPGFVGVPELPFDSGGNQVSTTGTLELLGSEYMQKFNAEVDGTSLVLTAPDGQVGGDGPIAYGLYSFTGLSDVEPQFLNIECLPRMFGEEYYVLLADFTAGDWVWFGPVTFPEFELNLQDLNHRFVTELGNMYFIVLCGPGNGATLARSVLTVESGGGGDDTRLPGTPHHLEATDGTFEDRVVVEWGAGDGAAGYEIWRRLFDGGTWADYGESTEPRFVDENVELGVIYKYKARSFNDAGFSEFSNYDPGHAGEEGGGEDPGQPFEIWASDGAHPDHVVVEWGYEGEYDYFELWRRLFDGGEFEHIASIDGEHFRYEDWEVVPGVVYKYKVRAILGDVEGPFSEYDTGFASDEGGDPRAPFELVASDGNYEDKVRIEWMMEGEWDFFKLYRRVDHEGSEWDLLAEVETTDYNDFNVDPGAVYLYKADAVLGEQTSGHSNIDSGFAAEGNPVVPAPFELEASKGTYYEKIAVWWGFEGDYDYFEVWRRIDGHEGDFVKVGTTEALEYEDTDLPGDFTFIYKARAILGEHEGPFSNTDHGYLKDSVAPGHPFELVATDGTYEDKVRIEWGMEGDYDYFSLWRKRDGEGFEWGELAQTELPSYNDLSVDPGVVYLYKVYAVLGEHESEPSNIDEGHAGSGEDLCVIEAVALNLERQPIAGVAMVLYGGELPTVLETNEAGVARFAELPRGVYVVVPVHYWIAFSPFRTLVDCREGETGREVVFDGHETDDNVHRLWGEVYKFNGEAGPDRFTPLSGIILDIVNIGTEETWQVETDEAGFWQIYDLPVGTYTITPASEHYEFAPGMHDAHINGETPSERLDFRGYPVG